METPPKLFISYSWSNPVHEEWVLNLATELIDSRVDVVLDKWDLKEGHDAVAFMEKMVTDPAIEKVVIVTDKLYSDKADGRAGGVGTETQIISKEVYDNQQQDKFVAVVAEKDGLGKPCLPTYYKSRIYIDLSEPDNYSENFEKLLRWIYGKPLFIKPELGKRPAFLDESEKISLGTSAAHKRAITAIKESKPFAAGALDEYLSIFSGNFETFRVTNFEGEFDDAVIVNIEQFMPYRNEMVQLFFIIAHYAPNEDNILKLHRFFESLIPYMNRQEHIRSYREWDFDNYKFLIHELFLYALAVFIKTERFGQASIFLTQDYYFSDTNRGTETMASFSQFRQYLKLFEHRNQRLKLNRLSLRADLLKQRSQNSSLEFKYLMQADFVLFMRSAIDNGGHYDWWPETLVYLDHFHSGFEIFARSISKAYFDKVKCLLNINEPNDLNKVFDAFKASHRSLPSWGFTSVNPVELLGYEQLAKKP